MNLADYEVLIRDPKAIAIIEKVKEVHKGRFMDSVVSGRVPFGLRGDFNAFCDVSDFRCLTTSRSGGSVIHCIDKKHILKGADLVVKWKVISSRASGDAAARSNSSGARRVTYGTRILPPNHICLDSFLVISAFTSKEAAQNCESFFKLKVPRFLIGIIAISQDIPKDKYRFVPEMDFTRPWTDEQLYDHFGLTAAERAYVEATIR